MTDREMLEFAAKAAGFDTKRCLQYEDGAFDWPGKVGRWNPLTDDGDALRLAVKLQLRVIPPEDEFGLDRASVRIAGVLDLVDGFDDNPYVATRLAIVRAAAEIGKAQSAARIGRQMP